MWVRVIGIALLVLGAALAALGMNGVVQSSFLAAFSKSLADYAGLRGLAGELANARRMGDSGIYDFFSKVLVAHRSR